MSDLDGTPTPDELEQQQPVVPDEDPDEDADEGADEGAGPPVGPLDDQHARADEGDLLEQRRPVPADDVDYEEGAE